MGLRQAVVTFYRLTTEASHSLQIRSMPRDTVAMNRHSCASASFGTIQFGPIAGTAGATLKERWVHKEFHFVRQRNAKIQLWGKALVVSLPQPKRVGGAVLRS